MAAFDDLEAEAIGELAELGEELAAELGSPPRLHELLDVLAWGAESLAGDLAEAPSVPVRFKPRFRRGADPPDPEPSRTGDLNDSAIVEAGDLLSRLARRLTDATGKPPTLDDLAKLLGRALERAGHVMLVDLGPDDLVGLSVVKARPKRAKVGDILAIPAADDRHHLAVALDRNVFGTALGLFQGTHPARPITATRHPDVDPRPVYVGEEAIASGRWRIIGHDDGLRKLFPTEPEIYHRPRTDVPTKDLVGSHGAAETSDGKLRQLSEEEAREVGLFDPDFTQIYLGTQLEDRLNAKLH